MIRVSKTITINGVEVTMLFTPRLFVMAEQKGLVLEIEGANIWHTLSTFADVCYCAALNHWSLDNDIEDFQLTRSDFHAWSAANQKEFGRIVVMAAEAISGKTMKEMAEEQSKLENKPEEKNDLKKKSFFSQIIKRLKHS